MKPQQTQYLPVIMVSATIVMAAVSAKYSEAVAQCYVPSSADVTFPLPQGETNCVFNAGPLNSLSNAATINNGYDAISNSGSIGTLNNQPAGILSGAGNGIYNNGGTITTLNNHAAATIIGGTYGVMNFGGAIATLVNESTISGTNYSGVYNSGIISTLINSVAGTISGDFMGIYNTRAGAITNLSNAGTINTVYVSLNLYGIFNRGTLTSITNTGTIYGGYAALLNEGTIGTVSNTATIRSDTYGIINDWGTIGTLINRGSITGGTTGIANNATILAFSNATPITYTGILPSRYDVIVNSNTSGAYGQFIGSGLSGTTQFGVHVSSTLSAGTYRGVLQGVPGSMIGNLGDIISADAPVMFDGRFAWYLSDGTTLDDAVWDLVVLSLGPDATNTLSALQAHSLAVRSVLSQRAATTTFALDYDCSVFDRNGVCVSVGARNSQIGNSYSDSGETAGILAAAYRITPEFRLGGFIDQNLVVQSPVGVDPKNTQPMLGAFAVYQENPNFAGITARAALAYQEGDLRITRPELTDTEAGTGRARTSALAFGGEVAYGFPLDGAWVAQPYAGLRRSESQRRGYTETTSESVEFPITYNRFGQQVTSATAGLRMRGAITPQFSLTLGAGVEYDLDSKVDRYAGTSAIARLESFSINASQQQNETRAVGSAGMHYMIASNQALAFNAAVRQLPYGNDPSITTLLRYSIGF